MTTTEEATVAELAVDSYARRAAAGDSAPPQKRSKASELVDIALERYRLAVDDEGRPFAVALPGQGPNVARPIDRVNIGEELAALYFQTRQNAVGASPLADALTTLRGLASRSERETPSLRVGKSDGDLVLDLGRPDGHAAIISRGTWWTVTESPIVFRRTALTKALPTPATGGNLDGLRRMLNVTDAAWPIFVGWIVATIVLNDGARPILFLTGEQGTGKTTAARYVAELIDPSPAPVRAAPKDIESWVVSATASMVVALDNLSSVPDWLADALCRAATGEGLVRRALYTDSEVAVNTFRRGVILTTIDAGALRGDLGERLVPVELEVIPPEQRRTDRDLDATFHQEHARALGAILDLAAKVLAELPGISLDAMPRMADFAKVLAALDRVTGWRSLDAYLQALDDVASDVFQSDPLAVALRTIALDIDASGVVGFSGTPSSLLNRLTRPDGATAWPRTAKALSGAVKRLAPALRVMGVEVARSRSNGDRIVTLGPLAGSNRVARVALGASPSVQSLREGQSAGQSEGGGENVEVEASPNATLATLPLDGDVF